uniref:Uncharacterized protein n=1 Tax=Glossina pallidipes TaxID=7398 RepID=A0A1A9Z0M3_GLOPL
MQTKLTAFVFSMIIARERFRAQAKRTSASRDALCCHSFSKKPNVLATHLLLRPIQNVCMPDLYKTSDQADVRTSTANFEFECSKFQCLLSPAELVPPNKALQIKCWQLAYVLYLSTNTAIESEIFVLKNRLESKKG